MDALAEVSSLLTPGAEDGETAAESNVEEESPGPTRSIRWAIGKHTTLMPTDAYGTIEFEG